MIQGRSDQRSSTSKPLNNGTGTTAPNSTPQQDCSWSKNMNAMTQVLRTQLCLCDMVVCVNQIDHEWQRQQTKIPLLCPCCSGLAILILRQAQACKQRSAGGKMMRGMRMLRGRKYSRQRDVFQLSKTSPDALCRRCKSCLVVGNDSDMAFAQHDFGA